ncbi:MAG: DUF5695 domain-containing protein [Candidatus Dormiibacterota bacterium]
MKFADDKFDTDYIADEATLGHLRIRYKMGENEWRNFSTEDPKNKVQQLPASRSRKMLGQLAVIYNPQDWRKNEYYADLELTERFYMEADSFYWTIFVRNPTHKPIVLGDIFLPLPFNTSKRWDKTISYEQRVVQHQFISGNGSFIYWMRPNGVGPYLVMTPVATCPLFEPVRSEMNFAPGKLEYADRGGVYVLSGRRGEEDKARGGNWRQPQTTHTLAPTNSQRDGITYAFKFRWAKDYDAVREILVEEGLLDVNVVPGMTLPSGTDAQISIRSRSAINSLEPEFPADTGLEPAQSNQRDTHVYHVKFTRLGENKITVHFGRDQYSTLEFLSPSRSPRSSRNAPPFWWAINSIATLPSGTTASTPNGICVSRFCAAPIIRTGLPITSWRATIRPSPSRLISPRRTQFIPTQRKSVRLSITFRVSSGGNSR